VAKGNKSGLKKILTSTNMPKNPQEAVVRNVDDIRKMSDDELIELIENSNVDTAGPLFWSNNPNAIEWERFVQEVGLNGKPEIVKDEDWRRTDKGTKLWRTVTSAIDKKSNIAYTAKDIAEKTMYGNFADTQANSDFYGQGLYAANSRKSSTEYALFKNSNIDDKYSSAVMKMALNPKTAKVINGKDLENLTKSDYSNKKYAKYFFRRNKGLLLGAIVAVRNGYNVIEHGNYYTVLDRSALKISNKIESIKIKY